MPGRNPGRTRSLVRSLAPVLRTAVVVAALAWSGEPGEAGAAPGPAAPEGYYFYRGRTYGSESLVSPLQLIVNGGYGILQLDNRDNRPLEVPYRVGIRNVWMNMTHPLAAIKSNGWGHFVRTQIIPISFNSREAYYWPNYTQHLLGGGMSYRMMVEWFRYYGYGHPRARAASTIVIYHLLNEVVENDGYVGYTVDPIADLYIFDPLSVVIFSSDSVARFFSETLHMADWSYQPLLDPTLETLENSGQNFVMKYRVPGRQKMSFFYHYGTHGEFGLSYRRDDGESYSFGAGLTAKDLVRIAEGRNTVDLAVSMGLFYDRDNSLMASLLVARTKDYKVRLNLYPGLITIGRLCPGFVAGLSRDDDVLVGLNLNLSRRVPLGLSTGL